MSALREILDRMYIDPELLAQLEDEQKQILFIKMREEQLRRWHQREEEALDGHEDMPARGKKKNKKIRQLNNGAEKSGKGVRWLTGSDGEVWVWVMGEHPSDMSIEQKLEQEALLQARALAEGEIFAEQPSLQLPGYAGANYHQANNSTSPLPIPNGVGNGSWEYSTKRGILQSHSPTTNPPSTTLLTNILTTPPGRSSSLLPRVSLSSPSRDITSKTPSTRPSPPPPPPRPPHLLRRSSATTMAAALVGDSETVGGEEEQRAGWQFSQRAGTPTASIVRRSTTPPVPPPRPPPPQWQQLSTVHTLLPQRSLPDANDDAMFSPPKSPYTAGHHSLTTSVISYGGGVSEIDSGRIEISLENSRENMANEAEEHTPNSLYDNLHSGGGEEGEQRQRAELIPSSALLLHQLNNNNNTAVEAVQNPSPSSPARTAIGSNLTSIGSSGAKKSATQVDDHNDEGLLLKRRESKILEQIRAARRRLNEEAAEEANRQQDEWEEQERRAKETERQIRLIAQRARETHQQQLRTSEALLPALRESEKNASVPFKEAIKKLARPPKPKNREAILQWFREGERSVGAGLVPGTSQPAKWFHGILSRNEADTLLKGRRRGSFLVRPSEKIFGYTISYSSGVGDDDQIRHFLVERTSEGYQFLGTNQLVHDSLYRLISHHEKVPITSGGKETLLWPVGQQTRVISPFVMMAGGRPPPPDYADLFMDEE